MVLVQQNVTVEIGQLWSRNLRMYMYVWCNSRSNVLS